MTELLLAAAFLFPRVSGQDKHNNSFAADKREFIKISQAVGVGFVVMGAIGYIVKLGKTFAPKLVDLRQPL